ncbi:MAG TPA: hypothetical protein DCX03_07525 [Bacteroidales bacterium]|nr:hypothetical protein [Bacteroidales bacterium]
MVKVIKKLSYIFLITCLLFISNIVYCQSYANYNSLINKLDDESDGFDAQIELQKIGSPAVEPLINALSNANTKTMQRIISILGEIRDPKAIGPLVRMYNSNPDLKIKIELESALKKLGLDRNEISNWSEPKTESVTESIANPSYSNPSSTESSKANEPIADDKSNNNSLYLWFILLLAAGAIWHHFSGRNENTNIQINPPIIVPSTSRPEDIIIEIDGFGEETETTEERNISARSKYSHITHVVGIGQHAQCICRSNIIGTLNDMGGTIKCNNCDVLQHLECARTLNQGRCINCQENLRINT